MKYMDADKKSVTVSVYRRSFFARIIPPEKILLDGMKTGWIKDGCFQIGESGEEAVTAFHTDHIGRGIRISWKNDDARFTELKLELPASEEEIDDFFLMSARLAKQDICEVYYNEQPFVPKSYYDKRASLKTENLRYLHQLMNGVLNDEPEVLPVSGVFRWLYAGMDEAETMWAGTDAKNLRIWLHNTQDPAWSYGVSDGAAENSTRFFETAKTLVLPNEESLKKTQFQIRFLDPSAKKIPGSISSSALIPALPSEKIHYLDAGCITVDPLSEAEILRILEAGGSYGS